MFADRATTYNCKDEKKNAAQQALNFSTEVIKMISYRREKLNSGTAINLLSGATHFHTPPPLSLSLLFAGVIYTLKETIIVIFLSVSLFAISYHSLNGVKRHCCINL